MCCGSLIIMRHMWQHHAGEQTEKRRAKSKAQEVIDGVSGGYEEEAITVPRSITDRPHPTVLAVQPLGTGNDMARHLNWGGGLKGTPQMADIAAKIEKATEVQMDRWEIHISPKPQHTTIFGSSQGSEASGVWVNYFSLGVDAKVVHEFEECRSDKCCGVQCTRNCCKPLFCCQLANKAWYGLWGGANTCYCRSVGSFVDMEVTDSNGVTTPHEIPRGCNAVQSLVLMNITTFSGGVPLWGDLPSANVGTWTPQDASDGQLEVLGIHKGADLGLSIVGCQCCVDFPRFAQTAEVTLRIRESVHMQVDGEAWYQEVGSNGETVVKITKKMNPAPMYMCEKEGSGSCCS